MSPPSWWWGIIDLSIGYEFRTQSGFLLNLEVNISPLQYGKDGMYVASSIYDRVVGINIGLGYSF
jgi:hypothetical protein